MALFYNEEVFTKAGVTAPPATWDEFYEAAKKIRALGPNSYITSDNGDAGFATSMMWLAGGKPFGIEGQNVTIDLGDEGVVSFAEFWQKMIDEDLINTKIAGWSDDWFKGLSDGSLASLITGAWMPANLIGSAPGAAGKFRVAATPVPEEGKKANAENGGSSIAILESSEKKEAAYEFLSSSVMVTAWESASRTATSPRPRPSWPMPSGRATPTNTSAARSTTRS